MKLTFISLYPDSIYSFMNRGIIKKAIDANRLTVECLDLRAFSSPPHYNVDDYPYSKRQGMLIKADILKNALDSIADARFIMPDPKGSLFNHTIANDLSSEKSLVFICPAFEGVDQRIFDMVSIDRYCLADAIVPTGDSPAIFMAEAIVRYLPDMLGCNDCVKNDSILSGLLEEPQYTAPRSVNGYDVPSILVSGDHAKIEQWKQRERLKNTLFFRPDLINVFNFNEKLVTIVNQIILEDHS